MGKICKAVETLKCIGRGNCLFVFLISAIAFKVNQGFHYHDVDYDVCVGYGKCDCVCPVNWDAPELCAPKSFYASYVIRNVGRSSDITVANFWKIERFYPKIPVKQEVNSVRINTEHGDDFYNVLVRTGNVFFTSSKQGEHLGTPQDCNKEF